MKRTPLNLPGTGRRYWKGLDELASTPEFRQWLEREFPAGAAELETNATSRRSFLQLMGASLGLAGLAACHRPEAYIVPYTHSPEWMIPGRALRYATAMPRRRGALPLLVTTFDGRPTKIEGNPNHPMSGGKTDAFAQASILDLYDPDRSRTFLRGGIASDAKAFQAQVAEWRKEWASDGGDGVAFILDEALSPTRDRLLREFKEQFPKAAFCVHEPLFGSGEASGAMRAAFGLPGRAAFDFSKADIVLAIGSDFLGSDDGTLADVREFSRRRNARENPDKLNRLYVAEHAFTVTGGMADHRFRIAASLLPHFAAAIARELVKLGKDNGLAQVVAVMPQGPAWTETQAAWIRECAKDLAAHAGRCAVVAGFAQHAATQLIAHAINTALGNSGKTVTPRFEPGFDPRTTATSLPKLAERIASGSIHTLFVFGSNPVYDAPADLNFRDLLFKVKAIVHHGLHANETTEAAHWHVPAAHYLESWADAVAADGSYCSIQPMILPLFGGWSQSQLLAALAGKPLADGPAEVQATFRERTRMEPGFEFDEAWTRFVHDGVLKTGTAKPAEREFTGANAAECIRMNPPNDASPTHARLEVVLSADYSVDDGRYINNGWMQEFPDPITKLTWENAAIMSPATSKALGLRIVKGRGVVEDGVVEKGVIVGRIIKITAGGRTIEAPVLEAPGHADNSITLHLGYGRKTTGKVGTGSGFNAYALRTTDDPWVISDAKIEKTDRKHRFAVTQEHHSMEGRAHVREAPLEHFKKQPDFAKHLGLHSPELRNSFESKPFLTAPHQWAMAVDLSACTGCGACTVACQAENNIPIVGLEQVRNGREMHWMRIDRYFTSHEDYSPDLGTFPTDPEMLNHPVMCQHCENAPCETVCPVFATAHNEEGLNVMAYNRCIGTRYCANNCPYKVRRFNFFNYNERPVLERHKFLGFDIGGLYFGPLRPKGSPETLQMQKNPNVSVRMRGVMEKCTFCVQRLETAKIDQKVKARGSADVTVPTDSIQTACQQACPADAIAFGNQADPKSRIAALRKDNLAYEVLDFLNVRPRVSYLARIRNPNPAMPGAEHVGMSALRDAEEHPPAHAPEAPKKPHGGH